MSPLLTTEEAAKVLNVSARTVRRLPIPLAKVGGQVRYDMADLEAYVQSRKMGTMLPMIVVPTAPSVVVDDLAMIPTTIWPRKTSA